MADEKEFIIITKAKDLAFHTYDMTTARRFPKRHGKLAVDLMEFAREIVVHIQDANELDVQDAGEFRERRYEQKQALSRCKDMLFLIELAERKNLISTTQCAAWTKYAVEVKRMTASWRKKDLERFTESRQRGNAPRRCSPGRFSWGAACSVEFVQRPQRQFLRRDELEQRVQRQQGRSPALVEYRE